MESLGIAFKGDDWNSRVGHEIGQGRYGVVSIAINEQGAHAAIKCLHSKYAENHVAIRRLLKELTVLRSLQHIAIPKILDQGLTAEGLPFLALELLKGETLGVMRKRLGGPIALDTVLAIAAQSLDALEYAHQSGIIHRDLSPNNFFMTTDGCLKLLDLGLCSALELSGTLAYITGRTVLGTPGFTSPEAARGESGPLDPRVRLWKSSVRKHKSQSIAVPSGGDILRHRDSLQKCLEEQGSSVTRVARHLNITRAQVYRWLKRFGIETDRQLAAR